MAKRGYPVKVISKNRTASEQARLYAQGRTTPGPVITELPGTPGRESKHQTGNAADLWFTGKQSWALLGRVVRQAGLEWGGDWKSLVDRPHVQMPSK